MQTYKFRLYPDEKGREKLGQTLELCRQIYNHFLEELDGRDDVPPRTELQSQLPNLKEEWDELDSVHSKVLQMVLYRLYSNLKSLSEKKKNGYKVGRLRFKGKGWFKTFTYNQSGFRIVKTENRLDILKLSKIGEIPIRIHREVKGKVKQITVKKAQSGKWFACIQTDHEENRESGEGIVGIDLNTENYLTDSDGNVVENPRFLEEKEEKLKKEHRNLSRKEKGSKNREKQRVKLGKAYEKLVNCRRDFIHKLTTAYVESYDTIILEDLNIDEMCEGSRYAKSNLSASWGLFKELLLYKAESAGVEVVLVDPKDTTQECNQCGSVVPKRIWNREHKCPECGFETTRDHNSALNIKKRGLNKLGRGQAESTPVDTGASTLTHVRASSVVESGSSFLTSKAS
ncbi:hypothetical protein AKJ51_01820 [candidate division MSBL1 archaeon SCGC-AAA382A20]|uniref:Transposase n=1 Tax=candidate division MSBL1 archaeon SCGC-AAA382A20 TaxID=1698280 RepID=A0A133VL81_9EURY|nr:hypothetical protein AKJ51_01820 [candidate division MSBL1 archaeon SCGC-AAA382A20]